MIHGTFINGKRHGGACAWVYRQTSQVRIEKETEKGRERRGERDISSVESQKGVIAVQRCSVENQKGVRFRSFDIKCLVVIICLMFIVHI